MKDAIELSHVSKTFRIPSLLPWKPPELTHALKDVSFSCPEEKVTCLLGPNGSGKTTVIKILAGLVIQDKGEARVCGVSTSTAGSRFRAEIGMATSNDRSFYWRLTGRQNLAFFASLYDVPGRAVKGKVGEVLEMVELGTHADKPVRQYSSGMKQRLLLARALLGEPRVMLLDEPTTHLDHPGRKAIHDLIRENLIKKRKLTVLLCTNDLHEARELADNLVLLNNGVILGDGPLSSFHAKLGMESNLILRFERLPKADWAANRSIEHEEREGNVLVCRVSSPSFVPDIVEAAVKGGGRLLDCSCTAPSLEEVFERMVSGGGIR